MQQTVPEYHYKVAGPTWANAYLWPVVEREVKGHRFARPGPPLLAFDLGCGSGATAHMLSGLGFEVTGIDPSESGIELARKAYPKCRFEIGSAYEDMGALYGRFALVVSLEVVEHCYNPRTFARTLFNLVEPGGIAIVSTPYHAYLKNLALAVSGQLDKHFTALWDGGHIKFFSINTLGQLLTEAGFNDLRFIRVGRIPPLAKSMIAVGKK